MSQNERRKELIDALRSEMPPQFTWDFGVTKIKSQFGFYGCAVGLASVLWPEEMNEPPTIDALARMIGLTEDSAWRIFSHDHTIEEYGMDFNDKITAEMVAERLEAENIR